MAKLEKFGSRLREALVAAEDKPTAPPEKPESGDIWNEGSKWWVYSGGTWVKRGRPSDAELRSMAITRMAEELDFMEAAAQKLASALKKALGVEGFRITCRADFAQLRYYFTVDYKHRDSAFRTWQIGRGDFCIEDEELAEHSHNAAEFGKWIRSLALDIKEAFNLNLKRNTPSSGGWFEATVSGLPHFDADLFRQAVETHGGQVVVIDYDNAKPFAWSPTEEELRREEERAVESIMRTLNERQDS